MTGEIRVMIADELSLFREAARIVLESQSDIEVVGQAESGCDAVRLAELTTPHVAMLSETLPDCDGIDPCALVREQVPECMVLVMVGQEDQSTLMRALEAGASGYLSKEVPLHDLIHAVRRTAEGETIIPPWMLGSLLAGLIRRRREQNAARQLVYSLTRREREVLGLLVDGHDHNEIADRLVISPETARTHIQHVLCKLGVHSRVGAAAFVRQHDLVDELMGADR